MTIKDTLSKAISWSAGLILSLLGLVTIVSGDVHMIASVIFFGSALFAFPPVRSRFTSYTGVSLSRALVVVVVLVGAIGGMIAFGASVDVESTEASNGDAGTPDPETQVRCWFVDHQNEISEAESELSNGVSAYNDEDYSRSLSYLENSFDKYESLNESAHEASIDDENLEGLLESYFYHSYQASAAAYSWVYEFHVNEDMAAAEERLSVFERHANNAAEIRQELKSELGVDQSTELKNVDGDCGVF